jgi:hypothetical protein
MILTKIDTISTREIIEREGIHLSDEDFITFHHNCGACQATTAWRSRQAISGVFIVVSQIHATYDVEPFWEGWRLWVSYRSLLGTVVHECTRFVIAPEKVGDPLVTMP